MRWLTYGQYRRLMVNPQHTVHLVPLLKLGPLVIVLVRQR